MSSLLAGKAPLATLEFHQGNMIQRFFRSYLSIEEMLLKSLCNAEVNTPALLIHAQ